MLFILIMTDWGSNPRALSKALGALCNPRRPAAHGRSSPTASSQASYRLRRLFMLRIKSHLARTPLLLLSKSSPLRWASIWLYHTPLPKQAAPPTWGRFSFITICSLNRAGANALPCHGLGEADGDGEGDAAAFASVPGTSIARYCSTISSTDSSFRIMDISMRRFAA